MRSTSDDLRLTPFDPRHALTIASWVRTELELRWLAPSSKPPLTATHVLQWQEGAGETFLLTRGGSDPLGYGELKPMRRERDHYWLGHIIVQPHQRSKHLGRSLVRALLSEAFDQRSARCVSLVVFPENMAALRCYRRVGFRILGNEFHRFGGSARAHKLLRLEIEPGQEAIQQLATPHQASAAPGCAFPGDDEIPPHTPYNSAERGPARNQHRVS